MNCSKEQNKQQHNEISDYSMLNFVTRSNPTYLTTFDVPMRWKIICAYVEGLSKYRKMAFFLRFEVSFFVLEILTFFNYAN